jgi:glycosyltransferase involved in cell wall biosynthesis
LVSTPIQVVKPGVDSSVFHPDVEPAEVGKLTPDTTVFLNVGKFSLNKGHDFLVQTFNDAFDESDDVLLVLHCQNFLRLDGFDGPAQTREWTHWAMTSRLGKAGKIRVTKDRLPNQAAVAALMAAADCGVFPARGEGWNLEATELMAMGREVILTDYSGHTGFATEENARLVSVDRTEAADDGYFFRGDVGEWAHLGEPQREQLVDHLRAVRDDKRSMKPTFTRSWDQLARDVINTIPTA